MFRGRVEEDVATWTAKVQDFLYLADISDVQQVAYAATLLQDAASDWWHSLLKTRGGMRPRNFIDFADLLGRRFGSSTRVDRARAELRNIRQGQSKTVRAYSTRFEALLGKLPSWEQYWAKAPVHLGIAWTRGRAGYNFFPCGFAYGNPPSGAGGDGTFLRLHGWRPSTATSRCWMAGPGPRFARTVCRRPSRPTAHGLCRTARADWPAAECGQW